MKKKINIVVIVCFVAGLMFNAAPAALTAETTFVTIGSGDFTGVSFPTGLAIAKMINKKRNEDGIRATVQSTSGSVVNIKTIRGGYLDFGLLQSDIQ